MKKAVITTGSKQYLVAEGNKIEVELLKLPQAGKTLEMTALLLIDGENTKVGNPEVSGSKVTAKIVEDIKKDKVTSIRFKAKKRVNKKRGHRQQKTVLEITKIT